MSRSARATALIAAGGVLLGTVGCDDLGLDDGQLAELLRQWERWEDTRPSSYRYGVERRCFCAPGAIGPVRVSVTGDDVTDRVYVTDGAPVPPEVAEAFPSVDGLFEMLRAALEGGAHRVTVTYSATGVPLDFFIDLRENVADEEVGFRVVEAVVPTG